MQRLNNNKNNIDMKNIIPILGLLFIIYGFKSAIISENEDSTILEVHKISQNMLLGGWKSTLKDKDGNEFTGVTIITEGYLSRAHFNKDKKEFQRSFGGSWRLENNKIIGTYEFDTYDSTKAGSEFTYEFSIKGNTLTGSNGELWTRIDSGKPGKLEGAWLITGRKRNGEISRSTPGERKTMKILSGTRFQWIAYHTGTGKYFGTGGGTYTTRNGKYTENIEFFSRDGSRVGANLQFDYKLDSGEWHHSGFSSKGDPLYEIWTPRSMLDK